MTRVLIELARHLAPLDSLTLAVLMDAGKPTDSSDYSEHELDDVWRDEVHRAVRRLCPNAAIGVSLDWRARTTVAVTERLGLPGPEQHSPILSALLLGSIEGLWQNVLDRHASLGPPVA